jgi:Cft2 family RNA processing exonuclease
VSTFQFTVLGGGSEIGANSYLLSTGDHDLLLDCGIHPKIDGPEALPRLEMLRRAPQGVVVSHAHIDHCGAVPQFMKLFPEAECFATQPTVSIMDRMLHNSVSVMETLGNERGVEGYPLYTHGDVDRAIRRCYGLSLDKEFAPAWESVFRLRFHHAGHVLGSAAIIAEAPGHRLLYTGDICVTDQELLGGWTDLDETLEIDTLVMESTRGTHDSSNDRTYGKEVRHLARALAEVLNCGGVALVPSFALGRMQELLNAIARMQEEGVVPDVPVYGSGLGRAVYEIYNRFQEYLQEDATLRPLDQFDHVGDVWDPSVRRDLLSEPAIIVATSGMMVENTPSAMIAMDMVQQPRHGIFFVGYLDPDTLGYKVLHAELGDELIYEHGGVPTPMLLDNRQRFHFSAHAPREELCAIIDRVRPKNVVFVHGDADAIEWMSANCNGVPNVYCPSQGETLALEP